MYGIWNPLADPNSSLTSPAWYDLIAETLLRGCVLVIDCLPVRLDSADAARDDFVKEGDNGLLGKVLNLV